MKINLLFIFLFLLANTLFSQEDAKRKSFNLMLAATTSIDFPNSENDGSGFLYKDSTHLYLITARHLLFDKNITDESYNLLHNNCQISFNLNLKDSILYPAKFQLDLEMAYILDQISYGDDSDIALIKLGNIEKHPVHDSLKLIKYHLAITAKNDSKEGLLVAIKSKDIIQQENISEGFEIFLFGFPNTIGLQSIPQFSKKRPLVRKGLIAGFNETSKRYILDAAAFGGNSGGPVTILKQNRYYFCGIVIENIPVNLLGDFVGNSGYSVMETLADLQFLKSKIR